MSIMQNQVKQIKWGAVLGYINYGVRMAIQLIYIPIMLRLLGQSEYGVYQLVAGLISYLGLLNFGFSGAYLRFFSQCRGDREKEARLNGTFLKVFLLFALLAGVAGAFITINSNIILGSQFDSNELDLANQLFLLLTINMCLTFPISVFSSIVSSHECFIFQRLVELVKTIANPFLVISLLLLGYGSVGIALVTTGLTVMSGILNIWYVLNKIDAPFSFCGINIQLVKEVAAFSFFLFLNSIVSEINWNVDKYILGRVSGAIAIATYSVGAQINNMFIQISDLLAGLFSPRVNHIVAQEEKPENKLNDLFFKIGKLQSVIVFAVIFGFVAFGKDFIALWAGEEYADSYYITLLLIVPAGIPLCQTLGVDIQRALNKHQYRSIVYSAVAVVNVLISIPLAERWSGIGSAMGTAVTMILGHGIAMNIIYAKRIHLEVVLFWKKILKMLPPAVCSFGISYVINMLLPCNNWVVLVAEIAIFIVMYLAFVYFMGLNYEERSMVKTFLQKDKIKTAH